MKGECFGPRYRLPALVMSWGQSGLVFSLFLWNAGPVLKLEEQDSFYLYMLLFIEFNFTQQLRRTAFQMKLWLLYFAIYFWGFSMFTLS